MLLAVRQGIPPALMLVWKADGKGPSQGQEFWEWLVQSSLMRVGLDGMASLRQWLGAQLEMVEAARQPGQTEMNSQTESVALFPKSDKVLRSPAYGVHCPLYFVDFPHSAGRTVASFP